MREVGGRKTSEPNTASATANATRRNHGRRMKNRWAAFEFMFEVTQFHEARSCAWRAGASPMKRCQQSSQRYMRTRAASRRGGPVRFGCANEARIDPCSADIREATPREKSVPDSSETDLLGMATVQAPGHPCVAPNRRKAKTPQRGVKWSADFVSSANAGPRGSPGFDLRRGKSLLARSLREPASLHRGLRLWLHSTRSTR